MKTFIGTMAISSLAVLALAGCEDNTDPQVQQERINKFDVLQSSAETSPAPIPGSTLEKRIAEYENVKNGMSDNEPNSKLHSELHQKSSAVPLVKAHYERIQFAENSSQITDGAAKDIRTLSEGLSRDVPSYITVRAIDGDNIDATAPSQGFSELVKPRVEAIRQELEKNKVNIAKLVVDNAGVVENNGEGTVMAGTEGDALDDKKRQYIVIAFGESGQKSSEKIKTHL
ncbi:hypothetical protein TDB9533_00464 [Thalassocella blandensis]|nr:hypothetical protein TDB9533_00464 [Thalassocella blandensis]